MSIVAFRGMVTTSRYGLIAVALVVGLDALGSVRVALADEATPIKREILALYDGAREGGADETRIHRFAEMPLNHLGFILRFHDIRTTLPDPADLERYRGVLTWFAGPIPDSGTYLAWASRVSQMKLHYVVLGDIGVDVTARNLQIVNRLLNAIGLRHTGDYISPTRGTRISHKDPELVEFECRLDPVLPDYPIIGVAGPGVRAGLVLEAPSHEGGFQSVLVAVSEKGGYAALNYEFCHQRAPIYQGKWLLDPFAFFRSAFGAEMYPIPDTTTVSGRRVFFSQLDGEGWTNRSRIERYRQANVIAAEVVLRELIEPFSDLPVTVNLRDNDLDRPPKMAKQARLILQRVLAQPQVEQSKDRRVEAAFSRFDAMYPSISNLSALASAGPERRIYSATSDENAYAGGVGPITLHSLKETLAHTENPRRLKGFNINYHAYSGEHLALIQAVKEHLEAARAAMLAPIPVSHYADIVKGFFAAAIERIGNSSWQIRNRGALQTVRFDAANDLEVDFQSSIGVLGQTASGASLYVALDASVEPAIVVLRPVAASKGLDQSMALVDSRWLVRNLVRDKCSLGLEAQGYGDGAFTWVGPAYATFGIVVSRHGSDLWRRTVQADASGRLAFVVSVGAIDPVTIRMSCGGAGGH